MATTVRHQRQRFASEHVRVRDLAILEVGAFDAPTWIGEDVPGHLRYLDRYSTSELSEIRRGNPNRNQDRRIRVDYVVTDKHFARHVPERFDLVVANHVIEHIADPVTWLSEVGELTVAGGHLLMAIPDRRYTFDYLRPESTAVDLLRARAADLARPDYWQVFASLYMYRPIKAADCWPGPPPDAKLAARRFDLRTAMARADRARQEYVDCHCFVFSEHTFGPLIDELSEAGFIPWRRVAWRGIEEGGNEFLVLLVKEDGAGGSSD